MPRSTSDPKQSRIQLRLNEKMISHVERQRKRLGMSVSDYIRSLIQKDINNSEKRTLKC